MIGQSGDQVISIARVGHKVILQLGDWAIGGSGDGKLVLGHLYLKQLSKRAIV